MADKQKTLEDVHAELCAEFPPNSVKYRVGATWPNNRGGRSGIPLAYIDATAVEDLLDGVAGPENWSDSYQMLGPTSMLCRLTVLGVTKEGVGEAGDGEGEKLKSAESDALKRAAVKFGIGRYLRRVKLPPIDLVERPNGKSELPRDWRPGESPAAFERHQDERQQSRTAPLKGDEHTPSAPVVDGIKIRPPNRHKLFPSKVNALKARARDVCGWDDKTLTKAVMKWYGAPSLEDLQTGEFAELMEHKLAAAAAEIQKRKEQTA